MLFECTFEPSSHKTSAHQAQGLEPKGRGYRGGQQFFALTNRTSPKNPVDSTTLKVQTNDHQERINPSMLSLREKVLTICNEEVGFPKKHSSRGKALGYADVVWVIYSCSVQVKVYMPNTTIVKGGGMFSLERTE